MSLPVLPLADLLPKAIAPYVAMMMIGFVVAVAGHMSRARWLVAVGVMLIFLATLVFPLARIATEDNPPPPEDPRQKQYP